ncbi:uncharacterized protein I206_102153 [Kwoniella pini CBS 10737]|uniref:F-box domain-containing protein n=1 Tax=Kwoniella pini CBS 10737 TaxID=1296096 RepID=A0A1B9HUN7_9TREE|nr:uncharacterized protein I206_06753 [Kwoniella pini CBS 10737]OCF46979.1 hypothetical protein I206_06753 [Kwoniella pini CBS 10737]
MPSRPSPTQRREVNRLSVNIGKLPPEIVHYIIEIIKARRDTLTILNLIRTCRELYRSCAPLLYEQIYLISREDCSELFYGMGPDFNGSIIPQHTPSPKSDKTSFARKFNLLQAIREMTIFEINCIPMIVQLINDCWGPTYDPKIEIFGNLVYLCFCSSIMMDLDLEPLERGEQLCDLLISQFVYTLCFDMGGEPLGSFAEAPFHAAISLISLGTQFTRVRS